MPALPLHPSDGPADPDRSDPLLAGLTVPQAQAVRTTEGPLLILAAAGSGKTRVITRRVAYLLSLGVPPWQILALTFTNKAAGEMRERVATLLAGESATQEEDPSRSDGPPEAQDPARRAGPPELPRAARSLTITTFHALCARLLRRYAPLMEGAPQFPKADYTIYDSDDQAALAKKVITDLQLSTANFNPRAVLSAISSAKNQLKTPGTMAREAADFHSRTVAKIAESYERALRAANAVDFDDLLVLTVRLLRESAEARAEVQGRWKYLMIDEYQDTNHVQFVLSTLLVGVEPAGEPNVCVVGDPDQSIYGWRGADIANILDFEAQYPGAQVIALGENFRSTAPILALADGLIRHNKRRKHKDLFTQRPGGDNPAAILCKDEHHEAAIVLDHLRQWHDAAGGPALRAESAGLERARATATSAGPLSDGYAWKDMAVFYRNNALSRVMEDALRGAGIPYIIARGTAFYQREEVKDALAYLRIVANPLDEVSLRRVVNKPARKIGATSLDALDAYASAQGLPLSEAMREAGAAGLAPAAAGAMARFIALLDRWRGEESNGFMGGAASEGTSVNAVPAGTLAELVSTVIKESGLEAYYKAEQLKSESDTDRVGNLEELITSAAEFQRAFEAEVDPARPPAASGSEAGNAADPFGLPPEPPRLALLRAYLERVSLVADADAVDPARGAVTLMTLHAAKGLEFPCVAIIGLEEGLLPGARALDSEKELEEERRLCFVGITRAMRHLILTSAKYRAHRGLRERTIASRFLGELPPTHITFSDQSEAWADEEDRWASGDSAAEHARRVSAAARLLGLPEKSGASGPAPATSNDPALPVGCAVRHPQFGVGQVQSVSGVGMNRRATIAFRDVGTKTLVLHYAKLVRV